MMQLIIHQGVTDFAKWKAAFDADGDARRAAGLTVLQVWKDADSDTHAFFLMEVANRERAEAWITRSNALVSDDASTVTESSAYFIETA